jgi:Glycosyl hydrolases family 16
MDPASFFIALAVSILSTAAAQPPGDSNLPHDSSSAGNNGTIATQPYTSWMINSYPNYTFTYGYFEERAQLPYGQGLWPAFWLYGTSGGAEIDVMEMYGSRSLNTMTTIYQTVQNCGRCQEVYTGINPTTGYHRYGAQWTASRVAFFIDGRQTASFNYASSTQMYIITNLAVTGPGWGANYQPTASEFPAVMHVSNINAYNPNGTCHGSLPIGTKALPAGDICVSGTNYVPAIPPTDTFRTFNHYNPSTNPGGTWQTQFWWGARTNNGPMGAVFYVDDTPSGFQIFPFTTGSSGLTITVKPASKPPKADPPTVGHER